MTFKHTPLTGFLVLTLAACGGNGTSDATGDYDGVISSGILQIEFPNAEDRAALPEDVQALLDDFQSINENEAATIATSPRGEYAGSFGAELDTDGIPDGDGTLIVGDVAMEVRFAGNNVNYTFVPTGVRNNAGFSTASGEFGGSADIVDGYYADSFIGTVILDSALATEETLSVGGDLGGAFVSIPGEGGSAVGQTIGAFDGSVANTDGSFAGNVFSGLFWGERVEEEPVIIP
jgi:hypothetical protein